MKRILAARSTHYIFTYLIALGIPLVILPSCRRPGAPEIVLRGAVMGTTYSVRIDAKDARGISSKERDDLDRAVREEIYRVNDLFSNWISTSDVSRFNTLPVGGSLHISPETAFLLRKSQEVNRMSEGTFDPGIGELIELWGFGTKKSATVPPESEIRKAVSRAGLRYIRLEGDTLTREKAGTMLNLSAIAKGYGVDRLYELLVKKGYRHVLVEVGGEIHAGDPPEGKPGWRIGIEKPEYDGSRALYAVALLSGKSMATSGDYRNYFQYKGKSYTHIINPQSGMPEQTGVVSSTIIAPDCTTADALATTMMLLGPEKGIRLLEKLPGIEGLLLVHTAEGKLIEYKTKGMKDYIAERR